MKNYNKHNMMKTDPNTTLGYMLESDHEEDYNNSATSSPVWDKSPPRSSMSSTRLSFETSTSPLSISPWSSLIRASSGSYKGLTGSLVREEGHIYSLATSGDLLYTGSDSKNIRVWKNQKEFSGFKASSGLVKAIIIADEKIFTGHQDGKIRVWEMGGNGIHKKIGMLPTLKAKFKSSLKPRNYIEVRKNRNAIWIKHVDVISSLCLSEDKSLIYSASWDKTIKVWRLSDSKCLESINAHDDAVNSVVAGFDGLVFTGSADGSVKVWRREKQGKGTKHFFSQTLLKQECAITSLAVDDSGYVLYCGSSDGLVYFWERYTFLSYGGVLRGHNLAVLCLATTGNLVFSGSADKNICVWRREQVGEHICLSVLCGHTGPVKCLAVEEEKGKHYIVYSGSLDKSVKIWRVSGEAINAIQTPPDPFPGQVKNYTEPHKLFFVQDNEKADAMHIPSSPPPRHVENYKAGHRFPSFQEYEHEAKLQTPSGLPPRPVENNAMPYKIQPFQSYGNADEMHTPSKTPPLQYHEFDNHKPMRKFTWGQSHPTQGSSKLRRSTKY